MDTLDSRLDAGSAGDASMSNNNPRLEEESKYNDKISGLLKRINDLEKKQERGAFTLVLVDGDGMTFTDDLVRRGIQGGEEAAKRLQAAIFQECQQEVDFQYDEKIVVKVYASVKGMAKTYVDHGIIEQADDFAEFVTGFNKINPLCDYIDAGNAKGGADEKIKAQLKLSLYDVHCRRLFLAACTDSDYASFIKSFYDIDVPSRLRLLKGPEFAFEFRPVLHSYRQLEFPNIFRGEKLPSLRYSPPGRNASLWPALPSKRKADSGDGDWGQYHNVNNKAAYTATWNQTPAYYPGSISWTAGSQRSAGLTKTGPAGSPTLPASAAVVSHAPGRTSPGTSSRTTVPTNVATPPQQPASPPNKPLAVERALVQSTLEDLTRDPRQCQHGRIRHLAGAKLGVSPAFWGIQDGPMFESSKRVIKWTTEHWMERTDSVPPGNATWLLRYFSSGMSPSAVLKDASAAAWRTKGEESWATLLRELKDFVEAKKGYPRGLFSYGDA